MARSTRSTDTERAFLHRTLTGIPADRIDALCDAVLAIAEHGESIDLGELKVGVHNLIVVAQRDPEVKARRAAFKAATIMKVSEELLADAAFDLDGYIRAAALKVAQHALETSSPVAIGSGVSPRYLANLTGRVVGIDPKGATLKLDHPHLAGRYAREDGTMRIALALVVPV